jgi:hypothetical protein
VLDGLDVELGQLVAPQGAADQQRQDDVVALALQGGAVGDGQQLFGLLAVSQFPSRVPFRLMLGISVRLAASSCPIMPGFARRYRSFPPEGADATRFVTSSQMSFSTITRQVTH